MHRAWYFVPGTDKPPGEALDVVAEVVLEGGLDVQTAATLTMNAAEAAYVVTGDITLEGPLDIKDNVLTLSALETAATLTLGLTGELIADEESTGKRKLGGRVDLDGSVAVDVVSREDLERTVDADMVAILRSTSVPGRNLRRFRKPRRNEHSESARPDHPNRRGRRSRHADVSPYNRRD